MTDRVIASPAAGDDGQLDNSLRPSSLADNEFIGQARLKRGLRVMIQAAQQRGEPVDHILLAGPPGLGKTTLANIIAGEMGAHLTTTSGPALERPGDLLSQLRILEPGDVFFIDEIHSLGKVVEEVLYPAMEDFEIDMSVGQGTGHAQVIRLQLPKFTLIGATTRSGQLTSALIDRFGESYRLEFYSPEECTQIVLRSARIMDVDVKAEGASAIARRSRGTARVCNRLLRRVRDYAQVEADGIVTDHVAELALEDMAVDREGLDDMDRRILTTIIESYGGGPVGLQAIAASVAEEVTTLESFYEPFLLQAGFLARTSRGRIATAKAYNHLGLTTPKPSTQQSSLL